MTLAEAADAVDKVTRQYDELIRRKGVSIREALNHVAALKALTADLRGLQPPGAIPP